MPKKSINTMISEFLERNEILDYTIESGVYYDTVAFNIGFIEVQVPFTNSTTLKDFKKSIDDSYKDELVIAHDRAKKEYDMAKNDLKKFTGFQWK